MAHETMLVRVQAVLTRAGPVMENGAIEVLRQQLKPMGSSFSALNLGTGGPTHGMYGALEKYPGELSMASRRGAIGAAHSEVKVGDDKHTERVAAIVVETANITTKQQRVALSQGAQDFTRARESISGPPVDSRFFIAVSRAAEPADIMEPAIWTARVIFFQ